MLAGVTVYAPANLRDGIVVGDGPEGIAMSPKALGIEPPPVFATVEGLPDELRTAITLREVDGLSYEEIAEAMHCPIGTVRSRIFPAREAIDETLRPLLSEQE